MVRAHLWISGIVQGVFYRQTTKETARKLGLTGWVRNLPDGRVEAIAEGDRDKIESLVKWCHDGPSHARVDHVQMEWEEYTGEFEKFSVV